MSIQNLKIKQIVVILALAFGFWFVSCPLSTQAFFEDYFIDQMIDSYVNDYVNSMVDDYIGSMAGQMENNAIDAAFDSTTDYARNEDTQAVIHKAAEQSGKYYYWIQRPNGKLWKMKSKKSDGSYTEEKAKAYTDRKGYTFLIGQYGSCPEKPTISQDISTGIETKKANNQTENHQKGNGKYYYWIQKSDGKLARMKSIRSDGSYTEEKAKDYTQKKGYTFITGQYNSYSKRPVVSQDQSHKIQNKQSGSQIKNYQKQSEKYYFWIQKSNGKLVKMKSKKSDGSYTEGNAKDYVEKKGYIFLTGQYGLYPKKPVISKNELEVTTIKDSAAIQYQTITKIIDGDTVVVEGGDHVRLLGIDADEAGYPCYYDAKNRLETLILGKEVILKKDKTDKDQYGRLLRYIFLDGENINFELVEDGLAICRFYEPDTEYKSTCAALEQAAIDENKGCKWEEVSVSAVPKWEKLTSEKTGLEVICAEDAGDHIGEEKIIEGYIASTKRYSNPAIFINFCNPYPSHCLLSIVWNKNWYKFPQDAATLYYGKTVRIKGYIEMYKGKPEIVLSDPSQIEIGE